MEAYIQISKLNDFIFCPKSVYLHTIYDNFHVDLYHDDPQTTGRINHKAIEEGKYSTRKNILQGISVYSHHYNLAGKIDIYDVDSGVLVERKTKIKNIYDGYRYQLYAQYFCLKDMGYKVEKMFLHSLEDNKRYEVEIPKGEELKKFEQVIQRMQYYNVLKNKSLKNENKCARCVYNNLCD